MIGKEKILWLWLPVVFILAMSACELFLAGEIISSIVAENGPLEILQFLILCLAFIFALICLYRTRKQPLLALWYVLAALGCLYTAGEEISWGQQFFKWATPETWLAVNDQQETNLHNTTSWLDQKPRLILEIGVIAGGLILPLIIKLRASIIPAWLEIIAPPNRLAVTAAIFLTIKIVDKLGDQIGFVFFKRDGEITEIYIYYFILLYLFCMLKRPNPTLGKNL
jgi:hypothetical protein